MMGLMSRGRPGAALCFLLCTLAFVPAARATQFHVAANVSYGAGNGSLASPWNLQYALYQPPSMKPGDTIWVHGGTYMADLEFYSGLNGTPSAPIILRNYNNERATLAVAGSGRAVISAVGNYVWYWGLEITTTSDDLQNPNDGIRFSDNANYNRVINCVVHDLLSVGIADQNLGGSVVYGTLMYYNGRKNTSNHGYNMYTNYPPPPARIIPKTYRDNISFNAHGSYQWHFYTQGGQVDSIFLSHNVSFSTLVPNAQMYFRNDTISGCRVDSNYWWGNGTGFIFQEDKPSSGMRIRGNRFVRGQTGWRDASLRWDWLYAGNTYVGLPPLINSDGSLFDTSTVSGLGNRWFLSGALPQQNEIFVRRNEYEAGRGHIVVYNWEGRQSVSVNVAEVLTEGSSFEVRDAQNYFGTPVAAGTVQGGMVTIPMTGTAIATPMSHYAGSGTPTHTDSRFGVFVITGGSGTPAPLGSFTATPETLGVGGGTTLLSWTSANATSASITPGIGGVALQGSVSAPVTATTNFALTLSGAGGSTVLTRRVIVTPAGPPGAVALVSPAANATLPAASASFVWRSATGAVQYHLQLGRDSLFASPVINDSTIADTARTLTTLQAGTYFWRVRAKNSVGAGSFSPARRVVLQAASLPGAVTLLSPPANATIAPGTLTFAWRAASNATLYEFQASSDSTFTATTHDLPGVDTLRTVDVPATVTGSYFWRVRGTNGSQNGPFTSPRRLSIGSVVTPTGTFSIRPAVLPEGGGVATLTWRSNGAFSASIDKGIGTVPLNDSTTVRLGYSTRFMLVLSGGGGTIELSDSVTVTMPAKQESEDLSQEGTPLALIAVPTGSGSKDIEVLRDGVTPSAGSANANLQYDTYTGGSPRALDWVGYTFPASQTLARLVFQEGMNYANGGWFDSVGIQVRNGGVWRPVTGLSSTPAYPGGNGISYETFEFSFTPATGDAIRLVGAPGGSAHFISAAELRVFTSSTTDTGGGGGALPKEFSLSQNYPNPFNPSTRIEYSLPYGTAVRITVYDLLGREVARPMDGPQTAGTHFVQFSGSGLPSGVYFYILLSGPFSEVRKMVLLK